MPEKRYKIIIADTSCLIGLTNIGHLDVLQQLFETVTITPEVAGEYGELLPSWICTQGVTDTSKTFAYNKILDVGESSAIALAMETKEVLLIVDDLQARQFAVSLGLEITGTLGVLLRAYDDDILPDLAIVVSKLRESGFRLPANTEHLLFNITITHKIKVIQRITSKKPRKDDLTKFNIPYLFV
jgi:predicted nucleic acid-binding protein